MLLHVYIEERHYPIEVPQKLVDDSEEFFARMDGDMAKGWQMGRQWVESPDTVQRCQIAADRLMVALAVENEAVATMMAGYLLSRMPGLGAVHIDTSGEMVGTELLMGGEGA